MSRVFAVLFPPLCKERLLLGTLASRNSPQVCHQSSTRGLKHARTAFSAPIAFASHPFSAAYPSEQTLPSRAAFRDAEVALPKGFEAESNLALARIIRPFPTSNL